MISWMSNKHNFVVMSIVEVEYISSSMASCEVVWLGKIFVELFE